MARFEHTLTGRSGAIGLNRDEHGVAHIHAESRDDALHGMGYCHARDRGLQMLFVRVLGAGLGSRWFESSEMMLKIDRYFRRCNFAADSETEYARLSSSARAGIDAYCEGINHFFDNEGIPWELRFLGYGKGYTPWTFADSMITGKVIGFVSLGGTQGEIERWIIDCVRAGVPTSALEELFPRGLAGLDLDLIRRLNIDEPIVPPELWMVPGLPWAMASNSWVIDGSRTESGKPLLSNDPHLEINRIPPVWYEVALAWPGHTAIGATMPGAPGIVLGRNERVSWGVTYSYMDCIDSWIEDCRDETYRRGDDWKPLQKRVETIERKGKPAETVTFFETDEHGTLFGDPREMPGLYLSSRWSCGVGTTAEAVTALIEMLEAGSVDEGRKTIANLNNSAWVFVLADVDGNIGLQMTGKMPIRAEGVSGLIPLPGWEVENDWQGFASFEDLPRGMYPENGFYVTANNNLNPFGKLKPITLNVVPYRAERIQELIENHVGKFTAEDMKRIQLDVMSTQARTFLELMRPVLEEIPDDPDSSRLLGWNGSYDYIGNTLGVDAFERFYFILFDEVFGKRLGRRALMHLRSETLMISEFFGVFDHVLLSERSIWFDGRTRDEVYRATLDRMVNERHLIPSFNREIWFRNILLGDKVPKFLGFDHGPIGRSGGRATVSQFQTGLVAGRSTATGPSIRMVVDMGRDGLESSLPGGPSDRRFSPWYASELSDYCSNLYKRISISS